jgi:hypothetical protein
MATCAARIHLVKSADLAEAEKRGATRQACRIGATSRPRDLGDGMAWGGTVKDISLGGLNLGLCFPFSPGTILAVDLQSDALSPTLVCRVVHVRDHADGTWTLGCEFINPLSGSEIELLV